VNGGGDIQCVHGRDEAGQTALHKAAMNGWLDCIHLLLDHSIDVNAIDHAGIRYSQTRARHTVCRPILPALWSIAAKAAAAAALPKASVACHLAQA